MHQNSLKGSRWIVCAACAILMAGLVGCGNSADVSGKISYQGRPVIYGSVIFLSEGNSAHSVAIKPDGTYGIEGIPRGNVSIAVISRNPALGRSALHRQKAASAVKEEAAADGSPCRAITRIPSVPASLARFSAGSVVHDIELK